jgi:hypothetical protein
MIFARQSLDPKELSVLSRARQKSFHNVKLARLGPEERGLGLCDPLTHFFLPASNHSSTLRVRSTQKHVAHVEARR